MLKKALITFFSTTLFMMLVMAQIVKSPALDLLDASVTHLPELELMVFSQTIASSAGETKPEAVGQLDGAGVIGYVFPTNVPPSKAGFGNAQGILALAVTSHVDFDDTPLFDENHDGDYDNDGENWHSHWVVLETDERVPAGLSVKGFDPEDENLVMPPTSPGLAMYLDSPGYPVVVKDDQVKVLVPGSIIADREGFNYDAVSAYMQVNTTDDERPLLGVYDVYDVLSGDLSLPYTLE